MTLVQHAADPKLTTKSTSWWVWKVGQVNAFSTCSIRADLFVGFYANLGLSCFFFRQLLGNHVIKETLPVTHTNGDFGPLYYVAGKGEKGEKIFKGAVYNATEPVPVTIKFEEGKKSVKDIVVGGIKKILGVPTKATLWTQTGPGLSEEEQYAVNDPFTRVNVVTEKKTVVTADKDGVFRFKLEPLSVAVLEA